MCIDLKGLGFESVHIYCVLLNAYKNSWCVKKREWHVELFYILLGNIAHVYNTCTHIQWIVKFIMLLLSNYTILSIIPSNIHEVIMLNVSKYWACNIVFLTMKVTLVVQVGLG